MSENIKLIYTRMQNQLFHMIPEKWDKIYLYASVVKRFGNFESGEMFFYYFPKGILKKNPINSYEIPRKFNLDEKEYLKLAVKLYDLIKELKTEYKKQTNKEWTSITVKVENLKFTVEFHYDELPIIEEQIEARRILWAYKNLKITKESLNKMQRALLENELEKTKNIKENITIYSENMYRNPIKNIVKYDKEVKENVFKVEENNYKVKCQILSLGA